MVEEGTVSPEIVPLPMDLLAWKKLKVVFFTIWAITTVSINPSLA